MEEHNFLLDTMMKVGQDQEAIEMYGRSGHDDAVGTIRSLMALII
jgi:hypothetical protein